MGWDEAAQLLVRKVELPTAAARKQARRSVVGKGSFQRRVEVANVHGPVLEVDFGSKARATAAHAFESSLPSRVGGRVSRVRRSPSFIASWSLRVCLFATHNTKVRHQRWCRRTSDHGRSWLLQVCAGDRFTFAAERSCTRQRHRRCWRCHWHALQRHGSPSDGTGQPNCNVGCRRRAVQESAKKRVLLWGPSSPCRVPAATLHAPSGPIPRGGCSSGTCKGKACCETKLRTR